MAYDIPTSVYNLTSQDKLNQLAFAELQIMSDFYAGLTSDVEDTQRLCATKERIESIKRGAQNELQLLPPRQTSKSETKWDLRPTQPIGKAINGLEKYAAHFQSNTQKCSIDISPKDEFVSKQVSSLMFYGGLCSIKNYLDSLPTEFNKEEQGAMESFSAHLAYMKKELPRYLEKQPKNHLEIERINQDLNGDVLYPSRRFYEKSFYKYLPYAGNLFEDLSNLERRSERAFTSGFNGCTELYEKFKPIYVVAQLGKGIVAVSPIKLYFTYVLRFVENRLAQPDMTNVEQDKANAIAQLTKVTSQPYNVQLQMAKDYLMTHQK